VQVGPAQPRRPDPDDHIERAVDARLVAWVQSPSGKDDLLAWKRLLAGLDYADPRRNLAAAQIASLRVAYA
jgi:hypothetical protein